MGCAIGRGVMQPIDVRELRRKLWSATPLSVDDWDKPACAEWMDGWEGWADGSLHALLTLPHVASMLQSSSNKGKRPRVLDFGCGPGKLAILLAPFCERVVGLDVAQAMVDRLDAKSRAAGLHNVEGVVVNLVQPTPEQLARLRDAGPFDLVVAVTVFSFIARRPGEETAVLTQLRSLMVPGGLLVHFDWPDGGCGDTAGARRMYAAAGFDFVHAGRASIDGGGCFAGVARLGAGGV